VDIDGCIRDTADVRAQGMQMFHRQISTDSFLGRMPEGYVGAEAVISAARSIQIDEEQIFARWDAGEGYLKGLSLQIEEEDENSDG